MPESNIETSAHKWEKQNLVTIKGRDGLYDLVTCSQCGMKGKRFSLYSVKVTGRYSLENVVRCPKAPETAIPQRVEVIRCTAQGSQFNNLSPKSQHDVVTPPSPYKNDHTGVWVMGIGEPVKLLRSEYKTI